MLSEPYVHDRRNHCLPLLDYFTEQHPDTATIFGDVIFLVFPLMALSQILPCRVALHALDLVYQSLEV